MVYMEALQFLRPVFVLVAGILNVLEGPGAKGSGGRFADQPITCLGCTDASVPVPPC